MNTNLQKVETLHDFKKLVESGEHEFVVQAGSLRRSYHVRMSADKQKVILQDYNGCAENIYSWKDLIVNGSLYPCLMIYQGKLFVDLDHDSE